MLGMERLDRAIRASLEAVTGPLKGEVFTLADLASIGRDPSNTIPLLDPAASRRHAILERADSGGYLIRDLGSRNRTMVNDHTITEQVLSQGDRIQIGGSVFVYFDAGRDDDELGGEGTVIVKAAEAIYLQPQTESGERMVRDLELLLRFSRIASTIRDLRELQRLTLEMIREAVPAERAAVVLTDGGAFEVTEDGIAESDVPQDISRTIIARVLEDGDAILSNNITSEDGMSGSESLILSKIKSALAVPLDVMGKRIGLLYLESRSPQNSFDEQHLQLVAAFGAMAGLAIENARYTGWLEGENQRLKTELKLEHDMIGESAAMKEMFAIIGRVSPTDATVLVLGESGTGKEMVAQAIHANGPRATKPFVAINCAAIPESLVESELFGHEKGAFTGATQQKKGRFEVGHGGTIFLDEIGDLPLAAQAKLLRVLQERHFERVGGTRSIPLDIRLIAATRWDLRDMVKTGKFREDLYYRLNVVTIRTKPLRDRRDDILPMAHHFLARHSAKVGRRIQGIAPRALKLLTQHEWPGNVRELSNLIEKAVVLGVSDALVPEDFPDLTENLNVPAADDATGAFHHSVRDAKTAAIEKALEQANGNQAEAARALSVHPVHLSRIMKSLGIKNRWRTS